MKQTAEAFRHEETVGGRSSEGVVMEREVVLWHIALLLSGGWYFFRARDIMWCCHIAKGCLEKTKNITCFWDFNYRTMGARDMDMGHWIWRWETEGLSCSGVARAKSGCGWQGLGINNVVVLIYFKGLVRVTIYKMGG